VTKGKKRNYFTGSAANGFDGMSTGIVRPSGTPEVSSLIVFEVLYTKVHTMSRRSADTSSRLIWGHLNTLGLVLRIFDLASALSLSYSITFCKTMQIYRLPFTTCTYNILYCINASNIYYLLCFLGSGRFSSILIYILRTTPQDSG